MDGVEWINETRMNTTTFNETTTLPPIAMAADLNVFSQDSQVLVIAILGGCLFFLFTVLFFVTSSSLSSRTPPPLVNESIERRYQTIEDWLITKECQERCPNCERQSSNDENEEISSDSADISEDTYVQYKKECYICMEEFEVGDQVSWSVSSSCNHAYHFTCIREWLLCKKDCPYCRRTMLPVDDSKFGDIIHLVELKKRREERAFFCKQDGVLEVMSTASASSLLACSTADRQEGADEESDRNYDFTIEPPLSNKPTVVVASLSLVDESNGGGASLDATADNAV